MKLPDFSKLSDFSTPFMVYDPSVAERNIREIQNYLPGVDVYYAMKCNPNPRMISKFKSLGLGFEVASIQETKQLIKQGVDHEKIMCLHPIKSLDFLRYMNEQKIKIVCADSFEEVDKISNLMPQAKVVIRVSTPNEGSSWKVNGKYGIVQGQVTNLAKYCLSKNLVPYGLTFHVGSQCANNENWVTALDLCKKLILAAAKVGINYQLLSLGGGLPAKYNKPVPSIAETCAVITDSLADDFPRVPRITIEPGRSIMAEAGVLVTRVFGLATRSRVNWAYIDVGVYNGLIESAETHDDHFYPITTNSKSSTNKIYNLGGPTCVSLDTPFKRVSLPELKVGDLIYVYQAGAYTVNCACSFNGFPAPQEYLLEDLT